MGFKKWLARRGAVGGTARWAAKGYHAACAQAPDVSMNEVCQFLVDTRYSTGGATTAQDKAHVERMLFSYGLEPTLGRLVHAILVVEAGFGSNSEETQSLFFAVIEEELRANQAPLD